MSNLLLVKDLQLMSLTCLFEQHSVAVVRFWVQIFQPTVALQSSHCECMVFLSPSKGMQIKTSDYFKLREGGNVSVNGCHCVSTA